ncbi:Glycoside hydrolase family 81 protein [Pyrenophora teres f. teres]|uniref:glucan endo-1,3-beta-D-glucosidase n=1 Tax=Pyrenophora teres f. teres TaxID=97479 RepID=A0A6S6VTA7_9PLEO|nr:Glycoside hydrolase family 81 protein [Pyrenophora teres f. teres]
MSSMGPSHARPLSPQVSLAKLGRKESWFGSWRDNRRSIKTSSSTKSSDADEVPHDNIFTPIQADSILPQIPIGRHHPVPRTGVEDDDRRTMHTNSFYANAFLGKQNQPIWTHPYSLWWGKGWMEAGQMQTWGMCVSHVEESDLVFEPGDPAKGYINPVRKQNLILSAVELDTRTVLTTDTHLPFSVNINLIAHSTPQEPKITFPVVQGMSFITAGYRDATPMIQTGGRGFVDMVGPTMLGRTFKYCLHEKNGQSWVMYVNPVANISYDATGFTWLDPNTLVGPPSFKGTIQVAKNPLGAEGEALYDRACGAFVCEAKLTATVTDGKGTYTFRYSKIGTAPLLMFALPHHIASLDPDLRPHITTLCLRTTTKGIATAIWAEKLTFIEPNLPLSLFLSPWTSSMGANTKIRYPPDVLALIAAVAERDLRRAMTDKIPQESMYSAGKALAKFATIVWVIHDILCHTNIALAGLTKLKTELAKYIANTQRHALYYDDNWKGVVSAAGFTDAAADFGNTYYNDHHVHYSYFVYTAAVIGYLDPTWLANGDNKAWTNMLVKDFAETEYEGRDYPFQRSFDWWHGHSWSKGLGEAQDGKHVECMGEDGFASFAVKVWGRVIGDVGMEKRAALQLSLQSRTFPTYIALTATNPIHPPRYLSNKICGVLFENKVDYASTYARHSTFCECSYFSLSPSLIHGIHMAPLTPAALLLRPRQWVREEWDAFFSEGRCNVEGGWRSILYANLAIIDPKASYAFFRDGIDGFWDERWIDGGTSRTWCLVWAAALGELAKK